MMCFDSGASNGETRNGNRRAKSSYINGGGNYYYNGNSKQEMGNGRENNNCSRRVSERQAHPHPHHHHQHHYHNHHQQYQQQQQQQYQYRDQSQQMAEEMRDESEYTPVPVKQLIQEFEKTCRPTLQYKQISPKVIPIVQQCPPLDNDLSRFFESSQQQRAPRSSANGHDLPVKRNGNPPTKMSNGSLGYNGNGYGSKPIYAGQPAQNVVGQTVRYEEYDSSEDEIDDSFGESGSEVNYRRADLSDVYDEGHNFTNGNGARPLSNRTIDEYEMYVRQFDESNELFEAPPGFRNADIELAPSKATNGDSDPKAMVLAMVASQEEILDTMKHLRNTPVLENLVGAPSPHFIADVGNEKPCEITYQGPKIASYQTLTNYNTAPRGWDQTQTFYRPVTFGKQQEPIAYSDF
ncbi:uncharacterized protein [Venturia canescens]|uniref:uncharacterized protein n=1 Tax=Venturia canescens TaxID=32260 RepID=UPI001C9C6A2C|nr:uncharacterized protein LOC122406177 [Venturia canescens]